MDRHAKGESVFDVRAITVVALGAALGGIVRLLVSTAFVARAGIAAAPLATAAINVSGSFLIGLVVGAIASRPGLSPLWRLFLATGILGGYTTFSTFSLDAIELARTGGAAASLAYVFGSALAGIAAAYLGLALTRAL